MKLFLTFILVLISGCREKVCTPIVVTGGGYCEKTACGYWACGITYAVPGPGYSPVPSPLPLSNGLGPQMSGRLIDPHIGDTGFTTCDLNPVCKTTVAVPVPFGGTPIPSASAGANGGGS